MKALAWDRRQTIADMRQDIWRYLTPAAVSEEEALLNASALLQLSAAEVRTLGQLRFVMSDEVGALLREMPFLVRRLTTTTVNERETSAERVRGAIRWSETFAARAAWGLPHLYVTAPARRAYDTPENKLLVFVLSAIADFGRRTGWHRSTSVSVGDTVRRRVTDATRWRHARALSDVAATPPTATTVARVRSGRSRRLYRSTLDVLAVYQQYVARLDRQAIREVVESQALVASRDPVLLELLCLFTTIEALKEQGWIGDTTGLLKLPLAFRGHRRGETLSVFYQHAPPRLRDGSRYRSVQKLHGLTAGGLIPDLVLHIEGNGERWLLIEVKGVEERVRDYARGALFDLLAYRRAFGPVLREQTSAYGIGVAWGRELAPAATGDEVVLCTPDTLGVALEQQLGR